MSSEDMDFQLELKDRLPYSSLLDRTLKNLKTALSKEGVSMRTLQSMLLDFLTDIPDSWKDEEFGSDLKSCMVTKQRDIRPTFAGYKLSIKHCKDNEIPITKEVKVVDYFKLKLTIINLLDRLQLLIRREKIEYSTGVNKDIQTLEDLENYLEPEVIEE